MDIVPFEGEEVQDTDKPVGLLGLPRRAEDLWLVPRLWSVGKGIFVLVAVLSAGMIDPTVLEGLLLGISGFGLLRLRGEPRCELDLSALADSESASRGLALADLRDQVETDAEYLKDVRTGALLSLPSVYFGLGTSITLGILGSNTLGLSPLPWIAATAFTSIPAVGYVARGIRRWWRRRKNLELLNREATSTIEPVPDGPGPDSHHELAEADVL